MVTGKVKHIILVLIALLITSFSFAVPRDTAVKFLDKANELYLKEDYEGAYKYINQAFLVVEEDIEASKRNNEKIKNYVLQDSILYFAQTVYCKKLELLFENYNDVDLLDIEANLERYPRLYNPTIKKLLNLIKEKQEHPEKQVEINFAEERLYELEEEREIIAESKNEFSLALDDESKKISNDFVDNTFLIKQSKGVFIFTLLALVLIIISIAVLIIIVWKKRFTHQQLQQEQYIQAFKVMASNNNQAEENISVLEAVTDIYNGQKKDNEKDEENSTKENNSWTIESPIQIVNISKDDEEELKKLAIKCEELGNKIDSATGRKNNSKNVSEVVYKLSLELGINPAMAMVNFCAAMVYDAGFLGIDPDIMNSISLSEEEKEAMKTHVNLAKKYLKFVPKKYMSIFESACTKHHENMDGSGYPRGLSGGEIPQIARLIRVAESFISMSSKRLYRAPIDKEAAVEKLKEMPQFYDPVVVEALEKIV